LFLLVSSVGRAA